MTDKPNPMIININPPVSSFRQAITSRRISVTEGIICSTKVRTSCHDATSGLKASKLSIANTTIATMHINRGVQNNMSPVRVMQKNTRLMRQCQLILIILTFVRALNSLPRIKWSN